MQPDGGRVFRPGVLAAILLLAGLLTAPRAQQRDTAPAPSGTSTAEIRGVVVSDESSPQPIRRAIVTVVGGDAATNRSVLTEDNGAFVFANLPPGRFSVRVKKAAYLPAAYGASKPRRDGSEILLIAGQRTSITIVMSRGAVISGTLRDPFGQPLSGVTVYAFDMRGPGGVDNLTATAESQTTDDRGTYRFFGLMPGEYVIAAAPTVASGGQVGVRSTSEMDAVLAALGQKHPNGAIAPPPGPTSPLLPTPPSAGFAPIYFPGNAVYTEATRLQVAAGEERAGIDFALLPVAMATVSGTVSGDVANPASIQLSIVINSPLILAGMGTLGISGQPPDAEGKFKYASLPPGPLRIVARARRGAGDPSAAFMRGELGTGAGGGRGSPTPAPNAAGATAPVPEMLYGVVDLDVRGQDVTGISIALQPGGTFTGRVVFDAERAMIPDDLSKISVSVAQPAGSFTSSSGTVTIGTGINSVPNVPVNQDGTFVVTGIGPTQYRVACQMPPDLSSVWRLRSAMFEGRDLLDAPLELGPGTSMRGVVLTLSDKRTEISGVLYAPTGQTAATYFVVAFPADRTLWKSGARRLRSARPGTDGRFVFADLPPGAYLIAALTDLDPNEWQTPAFLEQVLPAGVPVAIKEGEKRTQDLKIVG